MGKIYQQNEFILLKISKNRNRKMTLKLVDLLELKKVFVKLDKLCKEIWAYSSISLNYFQLVVSTTYPPLSSAPITFSWELEVTRSIKA